MKSTKFNPVTKLDMYMFGKLEGNLEKVDTVKQLKENPPNIVVAECCKNFSFVQNKSILQSLRKRQNYVMSLGIYSKLQYVINRGKKIKVLKPGVFQFRNIYKPYNGQDLSNKKILFWRTGGIGDLLFINPILRFLKKKYPTCKIHFACAPQYKSMVENFKEIDKMIQLPFPASTLFDCEYHALFEGVIERTKEAEKVNAYKLFSKSLGLDIPEEDLIPIQEAKPQKIIECNKILDKWNIRQNFVMIQMRASSPIRTPNPKVWIKIINFLTSKNVNVVITDSPHKANSIDTFIKQLDNPSKVFNFAKESKSIDMSIAMTSLCEMTISTDSALCHIGASLGKKVFGLYGPFPGFVRMSTYQNCDWSEPKECICSPCFSHGHIPCKHSISGFSTCYDKIDIDEIFQKIDNLLDLKVS